MELTSDNVIHAKPIPPQRVILSTSNSKQLIDDWIKFFISPQSGFPVVQMLSNRRLKDFSLTVSECFYD